MANRDLVAIGASRGGLDALRFLAGRMQPDLPASILVTLHLPSGFESSLDEILTGSGPLPAQFAYDGVTLQRGHIYIAPPERHLLLDGDHLALGTGPRENFARPAIDPMFRSVGVCCGYRAIGVVLTGELMDGASGLSALRQCGGIAVVQEPSDAAFGEMPEAALESRPDHVTRLFDMPDLLDSLVQQPARAPVPAPSRLKREVRIARDGRATAEEMDSIGSRSTFVCPDCGGVLWEIDGKDSPLRYRCHVGHAYTSGLLQRATAGNVRRALGTALRALSDRLALTQRLQKEAASQGRRLSARSWAEKITELEKETQIIANALDMLDSVRAQSADKRTEQ